MQLDKLKGPIVCCDEERYPQFKQEFLCKQIIYFPWLAFIQADELDTVKDFLIKLDMKPCIHPVKISISSLNNVTVRPTKIMNRADKYWAHFSLKIVC